MEEGNIEGTDAAPPAPMPSSPAKLLDPGDAICLDVRGIFDFAGGHRSGALCIPHDMLAAFAGWLLPADKPVLLVSRDEDQAADAATTLQRIGYDNVTGFVSGAMPLAVKNGPLEMLDFVDTDTVAARVETPPAGWTLLDVRAVDEYERGHIKNSKHAYVGKLPDAASDLDPDKPVTVMCGSGARATIAASQLMLHGFSAIDVYIGSMKAWTAAGMPTIRRQA